ncbi:UNKNOWN [Stylonychia lemnae]|uniref:Uncharacterized protein n=1 Tax=Stylonychia lemnae TaxID=5949 RepID=A0A078AQW6_STYLE|nr:UNKNOWN [Stylonychia lemnae]|eukprot:CDW84815.1 UNKNOWN [Stylonychia lemnae]
MVTKLSELFAFTKIFFLMMRYGTQRLCFKSQRLINIKSCEPFVQGSKIDKFTSYEQSKFEDQGICQARRKKNQRLNALFSNQRGLLIEYSFMQLQL